MSKRPENMKTYSPVDLKLGIKSSLPHIKSTFALAILLWECSDRPAELTYSVQKDAGLIIDEELMQNVIDSCHDIITTENINVDNLNNIINENQLFKSQIEALMVAFELVWKIAKVEFVDKSLPSSHERTGGVRYPKKLKFSINADLLHDIFCINPIESKKTLLSWIGLDISSNEGIENSLISTLTILAESAVFKLADGDNDVVFNQNCLYEKLIEANEPVDINGDKEAKGSLRILKSYLSDGLHSFLSYKNGNIFVDEKSSQALADYESRVDVFHQLSATKVINPENRTSNNNDISSGNKASNILLYGVPGCGKSHTIKTQYCNNDAFMERVVFHPDYTYSDFVGQILPKTEGKEIRYVFEEGPFTRILKKANEAISQANENGTPVPHYYLIVEEINRGNAPAIFGDLFQLLDRNDNGESEYGVTNYDIARVVYGDENHKVTIPSNLSILATMNTADQNVFTLDTAFKRRWIMKGIKNDIAAADHADEFICGTNLTWRNFAEKVNQVIISKGEESLSSEDNRLGAYFVKQDEISDVEIFANKVLLYLWNDAFKYNHPEVFPGFTSLEDLLDGFMARKFDVFNTDLFDFQYTENDEDLEPTSIIPSSVEQYLENKDESLVETYGHYIDELKSQHPDISLGATNAYIKAMGPSGQIFAEIHILRSQIKVNIKKPDDSKLLIGIHKPTTGWSLDYEIRFDSKTDLETMVAATLNSYKQIEG